MGHDAGRRGSSAAKSKRESKEIDHVRRKHNSTHPSHLRVRSRTLPGPRRRWSTQPKTQCRLLSAEKGKTFIPAHWRGCLLAQIPFKGISANTDLPACPPVSIHHIGQSYFSLYHPLRDVLSTPADNCFPFALLTLPPVIYHPSFSVFHNQWPRRAPADQHRPGLICAAGGERNVSYTCTAGALSALSSSRNSDLSPSSSLLGSVFFPFFPLQVDRWSGGGGGGVGVGCISASLLQPAFIRINQ